MEELVPKPVTTRGAGLGRVFERCESGVLEGRRGLSIEMGETGE